MLIAHMPVDEENINSASPNPEVQRDGVCLISRVPTEILETIFIHGACDYYSKHNGYFTSTPPTWVNVSYVCPHWRDVALNCTILWTYLFITSSRWTEELLVRSKQAPLKLYVNLHRDNEDDRGIRFLKNVLNHIERIQELRLGLSMDHDSYQFLSKLSSPAPHLQILDITVDWYPSDWWSSVPFNGDTPALRFLHLSYCPVPWHSLKTSLLTSLFLCSVPIRFQQNTADFLATLRCMQDLTFLALEDSLASSGDFLSSTAFNTFQKFNLPRLSHLRIDAPLSTIIALLSCIIIPLRTEVKLIFPESPRSFDDYTPIHSLLAQRYGMSQEQALSSPTIRSLIVVVVFSKWGWGDTELTFSASERDCNPVHFPQSMSWSSNIPLQIILHFDPLTTVSDRDRIFSHICCPAPWSSVRSIRFLDPPFSSAFWTHVLGNLPDLHYLKLSGGDMPDLASILLVATCDCTESHPDRNPNQIFAPALEKLELCNIVFSTTLEGDIDPLKVAGVQSLCDALATRPAPRGRLTMTRCTVRNPDGEKKEFDMEGRWEGGHFCVVDSKLESDTQTG